MGKNALDAFFKTLVDWESQNAVMVPKQEPVHGRIRAVGDCSQPGGPPAAQYRQLKTFPPGRSYGVVDKNYDGVTCIHMLLSPEGYNGNVNHRVPPQMNSKGHMQCVFGCQCKELLKCDEHFKAHYAPDGWRYPHRPSPLPNYRQGGDRGGKGRGGGGKGRGNGGNGRGRGRGRGRNGRRGNQYGNGSFGGQSGNRAERAKRVGNCTAYLTNGTCPLKSKCPQAVAHGYKDGVLLSSAQVKKIKSKSSTSNSKSETDQLKRDLRDLAQCMVDGNGDQVAKRARIQPAVQPHPSNEDARRETILRIASSFDRK